MPERRAARAHARERHVHRVPTREGDEPLHGTTERRVTGSPAHRLAERDLAAELGEGLAHELARVLPLLLSATDHEASGLLLPRGDFLDDRGLVERDPELARERLGRLRRLAVLVRGGLGRAGDLLVEIGLTLRDIRDEEGEPPWSTERAHLAVGEAQGRELGLRERR